MTNIATAQSPDNNTNANEENSTLVRVETDDLEDKIINLETTIRGLEDQLHALGVTTDEHKRELRQQLEDKQSQLVLFSDFLQSANTSVNAMLLSSNLTTYLNDVSSLNNPNNQDLGFSLAVQVEKLLEKNILNGKEKVGGKSKRKFLSFIKGLLNNPITVAIAGVVPAVSSIQSISDLMSNMSFVDKDIRPEDVTVFNNEVKVYVMHYQGLSNAMQEFNFANLATKSKLAQLQNQLRNMAVERIHHLYGEDAFASLDEMELKDIIDKHYNAAKVETILEEAFEKFVEEDGIDYEGAMASKELIFHDFDLARASNVYDQIDALCMEIKMTLQSYQQNLETVLEESKKAGIGDAVKIDSRIEQMNENLEAVLKSLDNAVHIKDVHNRFQRIVNRA